MDKIVCLGDSITYGYSPYTKTQVLNNYPSVFKSEYIEKYEIINSGNVGWQSKNTLKKLDDLCLNYKPKYCILMLGINDARGSKKGLPLSLGKYDYYMSNIIEQIIDSNIKLILLTPTTVFNKRVNKFADCVVGLSHKYGLPLVDTRKIMQEIINENNINLKSLLPDHVHLADSYYEVLGRKIYEQCMNYID